MENYYNKKKFYKTLVAALFVHTKTIKCFSYCHYEASVDNKVFQFLGNQIHLHVLKHRYCSRVHNLYMYDAVSRDVLARWTHPYVPEIMHEDHTPKHEGTKV